MMNSGSSGYLLQPAAGFAGSSTTMSLSLRVNQDLVNLSSSGCCLRVLLDEVAVGAATLVG